MRDGTACRSACDTLSDFLTGNRFRDGGHLRVPVFSICPSLAAARKERRNRRSPGKGSLWAKGRPKAGGPQPPAAEARNSLLLVRAPQAAAREKPAARSHGGRRVARFTRRRFAGYGLPQQRSPPSFSIFHFPFSIRNTAYFCPRLYVSLISSKILSLGRNKPYGLLLRSTFRIFA